MSFSWCRFNSQGNATKQLALESLPPVLLLQLKRFSYTASGGVRKVERHVTFDNELTIAPGIPQDGVAYSHNGFVAFVEFLLSFLLSFHQDSKVYHQLQFEVLAFTVFNLTLISISAKNSAYEITACSSQ